MPFPISAAALAAFRLTTGLTLAVILALSSFHAIPVDEFRHYAGVDLPLVHSIAASAPAVGGLRALAIAAALLFAFGLWTRWVYPSLVAAVLLLVLARLERYSAHNWGVPLVTMLGWLAVPWATPAGAERRRAYGFAVWWPTLTLGLALAAAACAKLWATGGAWVTTGAIRYHFVVDAPSPASPGLWIAAREPLAIVLSIAAIVFEAGFLWVVFTRSPVARVAAGAAAAAFLTGLAVFQGVVWWPWWWLLLALLPWGGWRREPGIATGVDRLPWSQRAAVGAVVATQLVASAAAIEREPLISNFPMYANTYASPDAFDAAMAWRFTRIEAASADGDDFIATYRRLRQDDQNALLRLAEHPGEQVDVSRLCTDVARRRGAIPATVQLEASRGGFDWSAGRFRDPRPLALAAVPLHQLCGG